MRRKGKGKDEKERTLLNSKEEDEDKSGYPVRNQAQVEKEGLEDHTSRPARHISVSTEEQSESESRVEKNEERSNKKGEDKNRKDGKEVKAPISGKQDDDKSDPYRKQTQFEKKGLNDPPEKSRGSRIKSEILRSKGNDKRDDKAEESAVQVTAENAHPQYGPSRTISDATDGTESKSKFVSTIISVIFCILAVFVACVYFTKVPSPNENPLPLPGLQDFESKLSNMKKEFKNQTPRFWKLLRNPTRAHINNTSAKKPLVIMLAASSEAKDVMECFAKKLASAIDHKFNQNFEIHGKELQENDGHDVKKMIDDKLKYIYGQNNRVTILHNLELLPAPSPILFYSYCDDQNAPFKHVAIIFTVQLPGPLPSNLPPVQREGLVNEFLQKQVWSGNMDVYGEDRIAALLSRITDTVVIMEEEQNFHCRGA